MTAMERLHSLLDARGVEWFGDNSAFISGAVANESLWADDALDATLYAITPEQFVEFTQGRETCKPVDGYDDDGEEIGTCCSECGSPWPVYYVVHYCPVCGAKVVDDASVD